MLLAVLFLKRRDLRSLPGGALFCLKPLGLFLGFLLMAVLFGRESEPFGLLLGFFLRAALFGR